MKQQAEIYKVAGVDDEAPALDPVKKRKADQEDVSGTSQEQSFSQSKGEDRERVISLSTKSRSHAFNQNRYNGITAAMHRK